METYSPGGVFRNPVCSASLCLIPYFIAVFVRHKMCLVAQFGKWLARIIFFGPTFFMPTCKKKVNVGKRAFLANLSRGLLFIFKELQLITDFYRSNSRGFLIACASIIGQSNWNCADFGNQSLARHADLRHADLRKGVLCRLLEQLSAVCNSQTRQPKRSKGSKRVLWQTCIKWWLSLEQNLVCFIQ